MSDTPLFNALKKYAASSRGYFRIPGHRFDRGINEEFLNFAGKGIFKLDVTETPLSDDLHNPAGVIAESQVQTAGVFGADETFFLVNGTTCGNQAMIMATAGEGEEIIIPRNAHKSVMGGLIMSGAKPIYIPPEFIDPPGIQGGLSVEKTREALKLNPGCRAIFTVSPTYHGFSSDITALSHLAHKTGIPLLVDEAHGAHHYFNDSFTEPAISSGADACAQSLHKVAGALTQSSLLHLKSILIDRDRLDSALRLTMSTSPSYILMTSLEMARSDLERNGEELLDYAIELALFLRRKIGALPGFSCPGNELIGKAGIKAGDPTRLLVNCDEIDITGYELKELLYRRFSIDAEMGDHRNLLFIVTFGNTQEEAEHLFESLKWVSENIPLVEHKIGSGFIIPAVPPMSLTPRKAYFAQKKAIPLDQAPGKVSGEVFAPYPPGIPVLYPGEVITREIYDFILWIKSAGHHFHGPADKTLNSIQIC